MYILQYLEITDLLKCHLFPLVSVSQENCSTLPRSNQGAETIAALSATHHSIEERMILSLSKRTSREIPLSLPAALTQQLLDPSCKIFVLGSFVTF